MKLGGLADGGDMSDGPPSPPELLLLVPPAHLYPPVGFAPSGPPLQLLCTTALGP